MRRVWPRTGISSPVSDVQNLFSVFESPRGNPRRREVKLVAQVSMSGGLSWEGGRIHRGY